jgi:hypothetical protein
MRTPGLTAESTAASPRAPRRSEAEESTTKERARAAQPNHVAEVPDTREHRQHTHHTNEKRKEKVAIGGDRTVDHWMDDQRLSHSTKCPNWETLVESDPLDLHNDTEVRGEAWLPASAKRHEARNRPSPTSTIGRAESDHRPRKSRKTGFCSESDGEHTTPWVPEPTREVSLHLAASEGRHTARPNTDQHRQDEPRHHQRTLTTTRDGEVGRGCGEGVGLGSQKMGAHEHTRREKTNDPHDQHRDERTDTTDSSTPLTAAHHTWPCMLHFVGAHYPEASGRQEVCEKEATGRIESQRGAVKLAV